MEEEKGKGKEVLLRSFCGAPSLSQPPYFLASNAKRFQTINPRKDALPGC
jgi:hypothetical protein